MEQGTGVCSILIAWTLVFPKQVTKHILMQILCIKINLHLLCVAEEINDVGCCVSSHICSPMKEKLLNDIIPTILWTTLTPSKHPLKATKHPLTPLLKFHQIWYVVSQRVSEGDQCHLSGLHGIIPIHPGGK